MAPLVGNSPVKAVVQIEVKTTNLTEDPGKIDFQKKIVMMKWPAEMQMQVDLSKIVNFRRKFKKKGECFRWTSRNRNSINVNQAICSLKAQWVLV